MQKQGSRVDKKDGTYVVVNVCHTAHDEEREIVKTPSHQCNLPNIQEVIPLIYAKLQQRRSPNQSRELTSIKVFVLALHPEDVHRSDEQRCDQTNRARPPDERSTKQVILGLSVAPTAHPQTEVHERPISRRGCQNIFFVRVRDESIVGRHHGDIEMPEIAEER